MKKAIPDAKKMVFDEIANQRLVSKADLMSRFSLPSSSMTRMLDELLAKGLIAESGFGDSTGGRKPILYRINSEYGYIFGLEISRIYSSLGLYDMQMNTLSFSRWTMSDEMTPQRLVEHVASTARSFLESNRIPRDQIIGIGIGAVGPLQPETGIILEPQFFGSPGWSNVPICALIREQTGFHAVLDNGANNALIGEHWALEKEDVRHMLYVHAGAGLRSAMMSNGQIVRGAVDMEGSIGQMIIQTDGPRLQNKGNYGALEAFVSVQALENQVRSQIKLGRESLLSEMKTVDQIGFDSLLSALDQGDTLVREQFMQAAAFLGIGLANLINVLHPEVVILGGALPSACRLFYETSIDIARKNTYYYPKYEPVFSSGELKEDAVAFGSAVMMLRNIAL